MRVTVILPALEGEAFEAYCHSKGYKKSTLISKLIREHIENSGFKHQPSLFSRNLTKRDENEDQSR